jgi:hypothetical protein
VKGGQERRSGPRGRAVEEPDHRESLLRQCCERPFDHQSGENAEKGDEIASVHFNHVVKDNRVHGEPVRQLVYHHCT